MHWLVLGLLVGGWAPVHAAEPPDVQAQARVLHEAAALQFAEGHYTQAIELWKQGFALVPRPGFLFNIASAQERLQQLDAAVETLRAYRKICPPTEHAALDQRIQTLGERAEALAPVAPPPSRLRRLPQGVLVGTGGVLFGIGAGFAVSSRQKQREAFADCTVDGLCPRSTAPLFDASENQWTVATGAWVLGGTLVVGGAVWALLARKPSSPVQPQVGYVPGSGVHVGVRWPVP